MSPFLYLLFYVEGITNKRDWLRETGFEGCALLFAQLWFDVVSFWDTKLKILASEKKKEVCFLWPLSSILTSFFYFLHIEK